MSPSKASPYHQPAAATFIGSRPLPIRAALKKLSDIKYTGFTQHTTAHLPDSIADVDELLNTRRHTDSIPVDRSVTGLLEHTGNSLAGT
jgi:hypothetical protein